MHFGQRGVIGVALENVTKHLLDLAAGVRAGVKRDRTTLMAKAQGTKIVEAEDVVSVSVSVKDSVHAIDSLTDSLRVEVGRGVDQHDSPVIFHHHGRASTPVARVSGVADLAIATQSWHTHRCAASEHGEGGLHI